MTLAVHRPTVDPFKTLIDRHVERRASRPVPLVNTDFDIQIEAGLAIVTTTRLFRNAEEESIEATMTFPVPVHATLFDLKARIGGYTLVARASRKTAARASYENAIDRGKPAVLHEEVLKGVHMLSVAHVPSGAEIEVTTTWVTTLTMVDGKGHLRIPLTVGDIYGRSPLSDADNMRIGGEVSYGQLTLKPTDSTIHLAGGILENGRARIPLNRPIDLEVSLWRPRVLNGVLANGERVALQFKPAPAGDSSLRLAVVVDHSGSMGESAGAGSDTQTKHSLVRTALSKFADRLQGSDLVDLWEFNQAARRVGANDGAANEPVGTRWYSTVGRRLHNLVEQLSAPGGGTEIGAAISSVIDHSPVDDILLITDGKSHALNVQELAKKDRRISVVLVGEDSLEANIGHLAALTGGEIWVSGGADLADVVEASIAATRQGHLTSTTTTPTGERSYARAGLVATFTRHPHAGGPRTELERAIAALSASFAMAKMDEENAARLAEEERLVTHLTSLVLVDEAAASQPGLPAQRKIELPQPAAMGIRDHAPMPEASYSVALDRPAILERRQLQRQMHFERDELFSQLDVDSIEADGLARRIDWNSHLSQLLAGDASGLPFDIRYQLAALAATPDIFATAATLGITPLVLVIGLVASIAGNDGNRTAERLARHLLKYVDAEKKRELLREIKALTEL